MITCLGTILEGLISMRSGILLAGAAFFLLGSTPGMANENATDKSEFNASKGWQTLKAASEEGKLIAAGTKRISVTAKDLPAVPLYPNAFYFKKGTQSQGLGTLGRGQIKYVKFLTRDNVSKVYAFYVGALKRNGYRFLKGADKNGFKAQSQLRKTIVSVKYSPLSDPKAGTQVGVAQCWAPKGAPKDIAFGINKWLPPGVMKEFQGR